jgi:hypothetical protein
VKPSVSCRLLNVVRETAIRELQALGEKLPTKSPQSRKGSGMEAVQQAYMCKTETKSALSSVIEGLATIDSELGE